MFTYNTNFAVIALNQAIANKRFALECVRTSPYSALKAATVKRLSNELRALEMQIAR